MKQPLLTERAKADLDEIWLHIALDNAINATRIIEAILDKGELLAEQPAIGRSRAEFGSGLRSLAVGSYLIFYRPIADGIEVVRIVHGARRFEALFRD
jgi:toxin ParE1/3/4